jgi:hypothetical protein
MTTQTRLTDQLRPHPLNETIYGLEGVDPNLRESIAHDGIIAPLVIDQDDTILSGHRRWRVAQALNLRTVLVVVRELDDPLDGERILIESNRQREKTPAQRQKEASELIRIIGAQGKERMSEGGKRGAQIAGRGRPMGEEDRGSPDLDTPYLEMPPTAARTDARVADIVGVKRTTFRKEREVYLTATGQKEAPPEVVEVAKEQWEKLNAGERTTDAAYRAVRQAERPAAHPAIAREVAAHDKAMGTLDRLSGGAISRAKDLGEAHALVTKLVLLDAEGVAVALDEDGGAIHRGIFDTDLNAVRRWIAKYDAARQRRRPQIIPFDRKGA